MIERDLRALAAHIDLPDERDLAPAVRARLRGRPARRRALVVVLAAVLLAVVVAFAVPPARSAILRFFHLRGVTIEFVDRLPAVPEPADLDLGVPVRAVDIEETAGFKPLESAKLGRPDAVTWDGEILWSRYGRVRLLVAQLRGDGQRPELIKKMFATTTRIEPVRVNGAPGYFIEGAAHVLYVAPTDLIRADRVRLAENVLLWQHGPLTLRLEGRFTLDEALRIAETFR